MKASFSFFLGTFAAASFFVGVSAVLFVSVQTKASTGAPGQDDGCLSQRMTRAEYASSALHEAGHTVVALALHPDWYAQTGVYPNGIVIDDDDCAEGLTTVNPTGAMTRKDWLDRITIEFGGYAEDAVTFGQPTDGSSRDIHNATLQAVIMVDDLGMGTGMAPYDYRLLRDNAVPLGPDLDARRSYEIRGILDQAYEEATIIVGLRQEDVDRVSDGILASPTYTVTAADVEVLLATSCPPDDATCLPRE